jgi:hypothetical protein
MLIQLRMPAAITVSVIDKRQTSSSIRQAIITWCEGTAPPLDGSMAMLVPPRMQPPPAAKLELPALLLLWAADHGSGAFRRAGGGTGSPVHIR